jgi:hypothetical protein
MESCREPLPIVRFGPRSLRFDLEQVFQYIHQHERHWAGARLESSDGSAPIKGKGHFKLAQKRFQAGSVRLRKDVRPPYWEGFYRDDIITEEGKKVRKRRSVYLGTEKDLSEKAESVSQFNREYSRFFGRPPMRDIRTLHSPGAPALESVSSR